MQQHKILGLPNWETVSRCRRKIQEKHPELKNPETARIRANWFWTTVSKCLSELQKVINELGIENIENLQATLDGLQSSIKGV